MTDKNKKVKEILLKVKKGQLSSNAGILQLKKIQKSHDCNRNLHYYRKEWVPRELPKQNGHGSRDTDRVILVVPGCEYEQIGENEYMIGSDDTDILIKELVSQKIQTIIVNAKGLEEEVYDIQSLLYMVFQIFQYAVLEALCKVNKIYILAPDNEALVPFVFSISVLGDSLKLYRPDMGIKVIKSNQNKHTALQQVMDEYHSRNTEDIHNEVRYLDGIRYIRVVQELHFTEHHDCAFRKHGTYFLTGGDGKISSMLALYLAKKYGAKLVLAGYFPKEHLIEALLNSIREFGGSGIYVQCNVTREEQLQRAWNAGEAEFGEINGIFHTAGISNKKDILKKSVGEFKNTLNPKIQGLINIDRITINKELDFIMAFSSTAAFVGDGGQCDYSVANKFMDEYATYRNQLLDQGFRKGKTYAVNWPLWKDGGMRFEKESEKLFLKTAGQDYLTTDEGMNAIETILAGYETQVAVFKGDKHTINHQLHVQENLVQESRAVGPGTIETITDDLTNDLVRMAARIVKCDENQLDLQENFAEYGFDSITLKEFADCISKYYDIRIYPMVFFANSNLAALTRYLAEEFPDDLSKFYQPAKENRMPSQVTTNNIPIQQEVKPEKKQIAMEDVPIAVIGMAGKFPQSKDLDCFWENLIAGKNLVTEIPKSRWNWEKYYSQNKNEPNKTDSKWGAFVEDIDKFDAAFFNMTPREAELMDPQQRLYMETVWEAFENAGYDVTDLEGESVGVFSGVEFSDYQQLIFDNVKQARAHIGTGNANTMLSNRISYFMNFTGPSEVMDTACSGSLVAVNRAILSMKCGECSMAVAGGVSLTISPRTYLGAAKLGVLSSDGKCKTFSKGADGYVKGEGVGAVILKPLADAERDGDQILAVIRGSKVNHGGRANSITAPNSDAQAKLLASAYESSDIPARAISYIETHGTGTELGDPVEIEGILKAFKILNLNNSCQNPKTNYCGIGSVKTNVGHLEPAAGIVSLIKVILSLQHKMLPGIQHLKEVNPYIRLEGTPLYIVEANKEWVRLTDDNGVEIPRIAGVSSFGFGGSNAHVVLEEYSKNSQEEQLHKGHQIFVLSAKTKEQLYEYAKRFADYLESTVAGENVTDNQILCDIELFVESISNHHGKISGQEDLNDYLSEVYEYERLAERISGKYKINLSANELTELNNVERIVQKVIEIIGEGTRVHRGSQSLKDIAFTLKNGRKKMQYRLAVVTDNRENLYEVLCGFLQGNGQMENLFVGDGNERMSEPKLITDQCEKKDLMEIAAAWVSGAKVKWPETLNQGKKVPLPTYPFKRSSYWVGSGDNIVLGSGQRPVLSGKEETPAKAERELKYLVKQWKKDIQREMTDESMKLLLLVPASQSRNEMTHMENIHVTAVTVEEADESHLEDADVLVDLYDYYEAEEVMKRIQLLQEFVKLHQRRKGSCIHVTKNLQKMKCRNIVLHGASTAMLYKMLSSEYQSVHSKTVDVEIGLDTSQLLKMIVNEVRTDRQTGEVCYRDQMPYVPYMSLEQADSINKNRLNMSEDKGLILTGGTGGIGSRILDMLAENGVRNFVLIERSEIPPEAEWEQAIRDQSTTEKCMIKLKVLLRLKEAGCRLYIYSKGLMDGEGLRHFISEEVPCQIAGVIHCAGLSIDKNPAFIKKPMTCFEETMEPKVQGLQNLFEAVKDKELDFFVLFSSITALIPALAAGASDYALANSYMDYFAEYQQAHGYRKIVSVHWPRWSEVGMKGAESAIYKKLGFLSMDTKTGLDILKDIILDGHSGCVTPAVIQPNHFSTEVLLMQKEMKREEINTVNGQIKQTDMKDDFIELLHSVFSEELMMEKDSIDINRHFEDFGVDSIMMAELVRKLEDVTKQSIEPSVLIEYPTIVQLGAYLRGSGLSLEKQSGPDKPEHVISQPGKVAVIGLSCDFPMADSKEAFWDNLKNGRDCITEVPISRWDKSKYYSSQGKPGKSTSKWGGFIHDYRYFDANFFQIHETVANQMDPLIRLALNESEQTFRDAGYDKNDYSGKKIGVFIGARTGGFASKLHELNKTSVTGIGQNFITAHVSHYFNLRGPNMVVDSACSSSLVSLHLACQSIQNGDCEMALAGGVDVVYDEKTYLLMSEAKALSPDGMCHTFDKKANGFVPGEGCGMVLLKSLDQAMLDGDRIYAVIESTAVNNDGHTMGITTPNPEAQAEVIQTALDKGNVDAGSVGYIEAHGTGTMIGDPIELKALTKVFRQYSDERQYCGIGSVKSNIGHLMSAAGIASFIKVVLSLQNKMIPPTIHCEEENPRFGFRDSPFYVAKTLENWHEIEGQRRAGISSFGFGGTNAHVIVSGFDGADAYICSRKPIERARFNKKYYYCEPEEKTADKPEEKRIQGRVGSLLEINLEDGSHFNPFVTQKDKEKAYG